MSQNFDFWSNKTPFGIFVDPATHLGFAGDIYHRGLQPHSADQDDPDGTLVKPYIDRLKQVCSFYAHLADVGDIRDEAGTYYTGWTGFIEAHAAIPPEDRRNVMIEVQEKWALNALTSPNFYATNINPANVAGVTFGYGQDTFYYDPANASGITLPAIPEEWRNDTSAIAEFSRQAGIGVPYLSGGLTPGSAGTTMGTFKSVAKRFYNDLAEYLRSRGTDSIIHYSSFGTDLLVGNTGGASVPKIGLRSDLASGGKSWWRRSFWHPNLSDSMTYAEEKGILRDLADASLSADMYGGSVLNWCPNIGSDIAYAWYAPVDRLVDAGGGLSSVAGSKFSLSDLSYWAARGSAALMHEFYGYADSLATSLSNLSYRKGLSMIAQLDSPVVAQAGALGGGAFAAQKWGYMKDPDLAADIDIFGAFGATDANVPDMRKPDQIWVRSSSWYNNKLLFESGTGNHADASSLGYPDDNFTARFAVLTARSQLEKRLFKRDMMEENKAILLGNSNQFTPNESSTQEERLQWLEENTLPNVYWDARVGEQYSEGSSNNVRFWSAATGNCLPAPCVFDKTSPIAAYLNSNNDIYKNDVRVAIKKWISEKQTSAIETAYQKLSSIYFTPTVQGEDIPIFVDPDILLPWQASTRNSAEYNSFWDEGPTGGQQYARRLLKAGTPYTLVSFASKVFHTGSNDNAAHYEKAILYYSALYGATANTELQLELGDPGVTQNTNNLLRTDGKMGGKFLPPYSSRAVMWNVERPWLVLLYTPSVGDGTPEYPTGNFLFLNDDYCCGTGGIDAEGGYQFLVSSAGSLNPAEQTKKEFERQVALGPGVCPHVFHNGVGLTPGSPNTTLGTYRKVVAKLWNDLSEYSFGNNITYQNRVKNLVHYAPAPQANPDERWIFTAGVRKSDNPNIPAYRLYWDGDWGTYSSRTYDSIFNVSSFTADVTALYNAQSSAGVLGVQKYSRHVTHPDYAEGMTYSFGSTPSPLAKDASGTPIGTDFRFSDMMYWQTRDTSTQIAKYDSAILDAGLTSNASLKYAAIFMPNFMGDNANGPFAWNRWAGHGRKDPTLTGRLDALSVLALGQDQSNPTMKRADQIWVWDAATSYWWNFARANTGGSLWALYRNALEIMLFKRPAYTEEIKTEMADQYERIKTARLPGADPSLNTVLNTIQSETNTWLNNSDSNLTQSWWSTGTNNFIWYNPRVELQVTAGGENEFREGSFTVGATAYYSNEPIPNEENATAIGYVVDWKIDGADATRGQLGISNWILGYPRDIQTTGKLVVTGSQFTDVVGIESILQSGGSKIPSPCVLDETTPLAPWLDFSEAITTSDIHQALRHYIADYNCKYVEALRDTIRTFTASRR